MGGTAPLKYTPLHDRHVALGARMVPFAGWEMPVQYPTGILEEARAVRSGAGIFDVSHMGRIQVTGPGAARFLHYTLTQDVLGLRQGRARYGFICNEQGGIIDDAVVYRRGEDQLMLVCNAANRDVVLGWLQRWVGRFPDAVLEDDTEATAMVALQGPASPGLLDAIAPGVPGGLRMFRFTETRVLSEEAIVSQTGYTGDVGYEVVTPAGHGEPLWETLRQAGAVPCGLGARDVLRLEAALPLHGNDLDASRTPVEAGLERFVAWDKDDFVGAQALRAARAGGVSRRLVGFVMAGRSIPRHGYAIVSGTRHIGEVTSGTHSPTLDKTIGLGYVPVEYTDPGTRFQVDIRGRPMDAEVVPVPFYSPKRAT